ncbi:MAG: AAA family ATPase [Polyangiaceae bacterium]|nr:AAA family ATPase [Polyangiaceae bacterium]
MFFRAQNLGPLRDAEIDLSKDLIVLAGPNNSGKTYLAWSVYGIHRSRPALAGVLDRWARQLMESPDHAIDLGELFAQAGPTLLDRVAAEYNSKLHLCFAAESGCFAATEISLRGVELLNRRDFSRRYTSHLIHPGFLALRRNGSESTRASGALINEDVRGPIPEVTDQEGPVMLEWHEWMSAILEATATGQRERLEKQVGMSLRSMVLLELFPQCTIFPAERIAVNIFAKELSLKRTELVDEMVDADIDAQSGVPMELVRRRVGRYPWPIRDSLMIANDLANLSQLKSPFASIADELEAAVLGGEVAVSETGEMIFSPRGAAAASRLQMHLTASVVKSLSSLVFYFRHIAHAGDFLIIDEPELNLHPDNQRKITRILTKAVQLGFKVMMSTHSDYVLRELNHMIMLHKLPEDEAQALGYDPKSAIAPERVGVYLFNEQHASPVPVEETGFSIKTIDDVVNQINADEQRLYARLSG